MSWLIVGQFVAMGITLGLMTIVVYGMYLLECDKDEARKIRRVEWKRQNDKD